MEPASTHVKLRRITRPRFAIRKKLPDSWIIRVWTYLKGPRVIPLESEMNTYIRLNIQLGIQLGIQLDIRLRLSNSTSIHQFYYSASTWLRSQTFSNGLDDEYRVGTPLCGNLTHVQKENKNPVKKIFNAIFNWPFLTSGLSLSSTIRRSSLLRTRTGLIPSLQACCRTTFVWGWTPSTTSTTTMAPSQSRTAVDTSLQKKTKVTFICNRNIFKQLLLLLQDFRKSKHKRKVKSLNVKKFSVDLIFGHTNFGSLFVQILNGHLFSKTKQ